MSLNLTIISHVPTTLLYLYSQTEELFLGPLEEPEITFASTVADSTLVEDPEAAGEISEGEELPRTVPGLEWIDTDTG